MEQLNSIFKYGAAMEEENITSDEFEQQIKMFLDDFMLDMYRGNDHIIARKYFNDLFHKLLPKYFCACEDIDSEVESKN